MGTNLKIMPDYYLSQKFERHFVIVTSKSDLGHLEISHSLKVSISFVLRELRNKGDNISEVSKRKNIIIALTELERLNLFKEFYKPFIMVAEKSTKLLAKE